MPVAESPPASASSPLDLDTCYRLAVARSNTLAINEQSIRTAEARYWEAMSGLLPNISLVGTERLQNKDESTVRITSLVPELNQSQIFISSRDRSQETHLHFNQTIFDGFRSMAGMMARNADIESQNYNRRRSYQLLYMDVANAYYQILMDEGDLRIIGDLRAALNRRSQELQERVKIGRSRPGELFAAQSDCANAKVTTEQVQGVLNASKEVMSFLIGKPSSEIQLKSSGTLPNPGALESYLKTSGERPDILAAIAAERAARHDLSAATGARYPVIALDSDYYLQQDPKTDREWSILFTAKLPLFDGFLTESQIKEQKAAVRTSQLNLDELRRTADQDVRTAYAKFNSAAAQVVQLQNAVALASQNYQVQQDDYQSGITSNLDVLNALTQLHDLRRQLLDAEMNVQINLIQLHVSAGQVAP